MTIREQIEAYLEEHSGKEARPEVIASELDLAPSTVRFHIDRINAGLTQYQKRQPISHQEVRERWIGLAKTRLDAGTSPDAVINQIILEHGPRLTLEELGGVTA